MSPKKQFKWSSHNPVIMAVLSLLEPKLIVELGVGNFSTPLLLDSAAEKIIHIENDQPWLDHVQTQFNTDSRSDFRYHDLGPSIDKATARIRLPRDRQQDHIRYYLELVTELKEIDLQPRLLFVDHFTCVRTSAINTLADQFDAVIYHDAECPAVYEYHDIRQDFTDEFDSFMLKTISSWTGCMLRKGLLDHDALASAIMRECEIFGQKFGKSIDIFSWEKA